MILTKLLMMLFLGCLFQFLRKHTSLYILLSGSEKFCLKIYR